MLSAVSTRAREVSAFAPLKVSLVIRRGWGVVGRRGRGQATGNRTPTTPAEKTKTEVVDKKKREAVGLGGDQKNDMPKWLIMVPCEAGFLRAGRQAGRTTLHFCLRFWSEFRGIPPWEPLICFRRK